MGEPQDGIRVLHVDDDPRFADMTATFLERETERIRVESAESASEGLERLAEEGFDCVVSDYDMPGRNGIELLEAVRERYPDLPFVLYTGKGSEEVASDAISAGVTDYLQKQSDTSQYAVLANRIENAVEQYRAMREVEASQRRLSQFIEQSPLGVFEWDEEFRVERINEAAEEILGYSESELVGESWTAIVPDADREDVESVVTDLLSAEGGYHSVNENVREDGERIECEWFNRVVTDDGEVVAIFSQFRDITARRERERELERYEAYLQGSTDVITVLDESGTIEYQSPSVTRILGYEPGALVGQNAFEYIHPEDVDRVFEEFEALVEDSNATTTAECRFRTADDGWRWLEVRATDRLDTDPIDGIVTNSRDITERKTRERELERVERRFEAMFNDPNILVGLLDTDGTVRDINETAMAYVDATLEEIRGIPFWRTPWFDHSPSVQADVREWIDRAADGEYVEFEADLERPDGEPYAIEGVFRPVFDDEGEVVSLVISDREVTERRERERELERIRDFFTEAERLGSLGAWEFDETGTVRWTDGTRRIHEVDDSFDPSIDDGIAFYHPEDRHVVEDAIESALTDGESYDIECRLTTAAGNQRWVRNRGKPVESSSEGQLVRGFIQDVTEQKRREEALNDAKSQLEAAVEAGNVATWEWHVPEDRFVAGPEFARTFGVDPDEAREGVPLDRFIGSIHEDDRDRVERRIEATLDSCGSYEAEYRVWNAADELRWVVARGQVRCDDDGVPLSFPGALTDITERKRAEQELERKNERLDEFTSIVSHDLRNPLSVASARLELARDECDNEHLADVETAHDRMSALINDLLSYTRSGELVEDVTAVDLDRLAHACWDEIASGEANLVVETDRTVSGDADRLRQVFENLFGNAVEHGGDDVTVTIGAMPDGFYVADDGPGIPPDRREEVFEAGVSDEANGAGFGLAIVEQVADAHGWSVAVTDGSDGGARFEITDIEWSAG